MASNFQSGKNICYLVTKKHFGQFVVIVIIFYILYICADRLKASGINKHFKKTRRNATVISSSGQENLPTVDSASDGNLNEPPPVDCVRGVPCMYPENVDFRIILLSYNRYKSLEKTLACLQDIQLNKNTKASLEIWIDRSKDGKVDKKTETVARNFKWTAGQTRVNVQKQHAGIHGQWIYTWAPREGVKEIAVIIEDDISVSPYIYAWLKTVRDHYGDDLSIMGYSLQSEGVMAMAGLKSGHAMNKIVPKTAPVFAYTLVGSWGFAPHPKIWPKFQKWFSEVGKDKSFKPYIPNFLASDWFKQFERVGKQDSMWTIWFIYYSNINHLFCVYNNLAAFLDKPNVLLSNNRKEAGLHYGGKGRDLSVNLLRYWNTTFENLPKTIKKYDLKTKLVN